MIQWRATQITENQTETQLSLKEIKQAAESGDAEAQYELAELYKWSDECLRQGVPQNIAKSCQWYKKLAENLLCEPEYEDPVNQAMRDAERLGELEELLGEDA